MQRINASYFLMMRLDGKTDKIIKKGEILPTDVRMSPKIPH